ncbi:16S rRNA (guanine(527)-N(7))-methyltransferase RsmG, partial [bacterium]|nr:16S rRNA (guanine(527)-N(7))-methyltransferase RsmG [bacterium]
MEEIFKNYPLLKNQNVPRETLIEFDLFISMLQEENEKINIISKETAKNKIIRE